MPGNPKVQRCPPRFGKGDRHGFVAFGLARNKHAHRIPNGSGCSPFKWIWMFSESPFKSIWKHGPKINKTAKHDRQSMENGAKMEPKSIPRGLLLQNLSFCMFLNSLGPSWGPYKEPIGSPLGSFFPVVGYVF